MKKTTKKQTINSNDKRYQIKFFIEEFLQGKDIWVYLILSLVLCLIVFREFIFGGSLFLFRDIGSDTINVFYTRFVQVSDYIKQTGFPAWSFNQGMGQNISGSSMGDPFSLIICMMGRNAIPYSMAYIELFKVILAGLFFFMYLKTIGLKSYTSIFGGLIYSFTGFMILGGTWLTFSTEGVYFALILLAYERYFIKRSWWLITLVYLLIAVYSAVFIYTATIFIVIYSIVRAVETNKSFKDYLLFHLKFAALAALGVGISSISLFSTYLLMVQSPRGSGEASFTDKLMQFPVFGFETGKHYVTALSRMFSNDLVGSGVDFRGWYNYLEAPIFYCGLVTLLLFTQLFAFSDRKHKILYGSLLGLYLIPVIFPYFRYAFWAFTGDYYRIFSLIFVFNFIYLTVNSINKLFENKISLKYLIPTFVVILLLLVSPFQGSDMPVDGTIKMILIILLAAYFLLSLLFIFKPAGEYVRLALLLVFCVEIALLPSITLNRRLTVKKDDISQKVGFNDYSNEAVKYLNSIDKSFFRTHKDYSSTWAAVHPSINDAMVQGYYSTMSYSSFNQINYINFLSAVKLIDPKNEDATRWAHGVFNRIFLHGITSSKYVLTKRNENYLAPYAFDSIGQFGNIKILYNKLYLPLGFCYDSIIRRSAFDNLVGLEIDVALMKGFVVDDKDVSKYSGFKEISKVDTATFTFNDYKSYIDSLRRDTLVIDEFSQNKIVGHINAKKDGMLFFSIPFDKGWTLKVDGNAVDMEMINIGFIGTLVKQGDHKITLEFAPPLRQEGAIVSLVSLILYIGLLLFSIMKNRKDKKVN